MATTLAQAAISPAWTTVVAPTWSPRSYLCSLMVHSQHNCLKFLPRVRYIILWNSSTQKCFYVFLSFSGYKLTSPTMAYQALCGLAPSYLSDLSLYPLLICSTPSGLLAISWTRQEHSCLVVCAPTVPSTLELLPAHSHTFTLSLHSGISSGLTHDFRVSLPWLSRPITYYTFLSYILYRTEIRKI